MRKLSLWAVLPVAVVGGATLWFTLVPGPPRGGVKRGVSPLAGRFAGLHSVPESPGFGASRPLLRPAVSVSDAAGDRSAPAPTPATNAPGGEPPPRPETGAPRHPPRRGT